MPRARPFTQAEVHERAKTDELRKFNDALTPEQFAQFMTLGGIPEDARTVCLSEINELFRYHEVHELAIAQEHPARKVTALKRLERPAKELLTVLESLPQGLRLELRTGDLEEFPDRLRDRIAYWSSHVKTHRPSDSTAARLRLFQHIESIAIKFSPDHLGKEPRRRRWVAHVLRALGIVVPNEKKNRARVTGKRSRVTRTAAPSKPPPRRPNRKSGEAAARERRLSRVKL